MASSAAWLVSTSSSAVSHASVSGAVKRTFARHCKAYHNLQRHRSWGAKYGYGPKQIISETGTLRSETFIFRNIVP